MIHQSETLSSSSSSSSRIVLIYYILLCRCTHRWIHSFLCRRCTPLVLLRSLPASQPATANCRNHADPKGLILSELNRHVLTFLHPILLSRITYGREEQHRWRCSFRTTDTYKREICTSDHLSGAEKNPKGNSEYQKAQLCVCVLSSSGFKAF
jgi:hypothetical protein